MPKLEIEYPQRKSFALSEQDFQNIKALAESYGVSDSHVIREALHHLFQENGLPVTDTSDWYEGKTAAGQLAEALVPLLIPALRENGIEGQ